MVQTKTRVILTDVITYALVILFMYTAADKLMSLKTFASTLAKSPLIGNFSTIVAWSIPIAEISISLLLVLALTRKMGLYASVILLSGFTLYLAYMVVSGLKLPCHCGGVISSMTWQQHIWFNMAFVILAYAGIRMYKP